ncbi:MAG: 3-deoxy-manno-octulosonate cytidylyltransferase [Bacteroidales bacterium]
MSDSYNFIGIIPARYASTRFPGKPLVEIGGKTMIQRVYEQASKALEYVYVATDDERIFDAVKQFNGKVVYTSSEHQSGTDRCAEAVRKSEEIESQSFDIVINIQGDEPFIKPQQIQKLMSCFAEQDTQIATLIKPFGENDNIFDANKVKAIIDKKMKALYFSRAVIPFLRDIDNNADWTKLHRFFLHIGLYAYKKEVLYNLTNLPPSLLEKAEALEQLRWLENGYHIQTKITEYDSIGIDTPEDIERLKKLGIA